MSVVLGEDPESEEEIDTSTIDKLNLSSPSKDVRMDRIPRGEVIEGEESETDEEDNTEETDGPSPYLPSKAPVHSPSPDPMDGT